MNRKASMELSVNSIVILVIAVVVMGLLLAFITAQMDKVKIEAPEVRNPEPASSSELLTVSPTIIDTKPKGAVTIKGSIYNNEAGDIYARIKTSCDVVFDSSRTVTGEFLKVAPGEQKISNLIVNVISTKAKGSYLCSIKAEKNVSNVVTTLDEHLKEVTVVIG